MTPEKTKEAFQGIQRIILGVSADPEEIRLSEELAARNIEDLSFKKIFDHLFFMTQEGQRLVDQNRTEKAMRWLGFLQGALWGLGSTSISTMKDLNRPDEKKDA